MTPLLTTADVMRELGVSLSTAKRLVARLPQIRIGRSVRVRREDGLTHPRGTSGVVAELVLAAASAERRVDDV